MEGEQLQRDDAQDALQAVHAVRHFDAVARVLDGLVILFVADDDGAPLPIKHTSSSVRLIFRSSRLFKNLICCTLPAAMMSPRTEPSPVFTGVRDHQECGSQTSLKHTLAKCVQHFTVKHSLSLVCCLIYVRYFLQYFARKRAFTSSCTIMMTIPAFPLILELRTI